MQLIDDETRLLREQVRRYLAQHLEPRISGAEAAKAFPFEELARLADFGLIAGQLREEDGGLGLSLPVWATLMEEAGYCWLSLRVLLSGIHIVSILLAAHGSEEQKQRFLYPLLRSQRKVFVAISEPDVGSNVAEIRTRAEHRGSHYLLSGTKLWITNGLFGDFGIVVARTFSQNCDGKLSLFLVEDDQTQFLRSAVDTMVLRSTGTAELNFENAVVPAENLLGAEGDGLRLILGGLNIGRLNVAMGAVGAAQRALDLSIAHARNRRQFGKPIASYQLVQKHIVDMTMKTEAARALGMNAAVALERGELARAQCSIAKLFATEAAHEVANHAVAVHGAMGYATAHPIERIFRDTRGGMIPEGTTEIQTLIIGREILGMSAIT